MQKPIHRHLIALGLTATVLAVSLASLWYLVPTPGQSMARAIGRDLETAAPAELELHLKQLESLQSAAIPTLVQALGSRRLEVILGARRLIDREMNLWRDLPTDVGSKRIEHLARLLASRISGFEADGREQARELVLLIMQWPVDRDTIDRPQLLATCEIVLRSASQFVPPSLAKQTLEGPSEGNAKGLAGDTPERTDTGETETDSLPGLWRPAGEQALPENALTPAPLEFNVPPEFTAPPTVGVARPSVAEDRSQPPPAEWSPDTADERRPPAADPRVPLMTSRSRGAEPGLRSGWPADSQRLRGEPTDLPSRDELRAAETIDVMRWLLVERVAAAAQDELKERKFSAVQIQVARQLVDPDPVVRRELVRRLPSIAGNDPRPWLLWLSRDIDPAVRRATVTIFGTSPDPAWQTRLRELAREETDAEVLRVVQRALQQPALR